MLSPLPAGPLAGHSVVVTFVVAVVGGFPPGVTTFAAGIGMLAMLSVRLVKGANLLPLVALAGNGGEKKSGGEEISGFHLPPI